MDAAEKTIFPVQGLTICPSAWVLRSRGGNDAAPARAGDLFKIMKTKLKKVEILRLFELARELQITMTHLWILVLLRETGPMAKIELARGCRVTTAAMTGALDVLAEAKLIDQRVLPGNRRRHEVWLSDLGAMVMRTRNVTPV
jgi:DNA-binding MarR family transcriptional regulator